MHCTPKYFFLTSSKIFTFFTAVLFSCNFLNCVTKLINKFVRTYLCRRTEHPYHDIILVYVILYSFIVFCLAVAVGFCYISFLEISRGYI